MIKIVLGRLIFGLSFLSSVSKGIESPDQSHSTNETEPTMLDRWNEVQRQAALATGAIKVLPPVRRVKKYAKPEIIIKESSVFFDGTLLEFSRPLTAWKDILKRKPHCDTTGTEWCVWEDLGLTASTSWENKLSVSTMIINLSIPEHLLNETRTPYPDGTPDNTPKADWLARRPFTGYLEIDGFGIDKETKFWELESSINARRNLSCGLRSCEFPRGILGPSTMIDLHLNGERESATIEEIKIYSTSY